MFEHVTGKWDADVETSICLEEKRIQHDCMCEMNPNQDNAVLEHERNQSSVMSSCLHFNNSFKWYQSFQYCSSWVAEMQFSRQGILGYFHNQSAMIFEHLIKVCIWFNINHSSTCLVLVGSILQEHKKMWWNTDSLEDCACWIALNISLIIRTTKSLSMHVYWMFHCAELFHYSTSITSWY